MTDPLPTLGPAVRAQALALLVAAMGPVLVWSMGLQGTDRPDGNVVFHLVGTQEPLLLLLSGCALALIAVLARDASPLEPPRYRPRHVLVLGVIAAGIGWLGWRLVFDQFLLSGDEFLADWAASTLRTGSLEAPVPEHLRGVGAALTSAYGSYVPDHGALRAGYLPGWAAVRGVFGALGDPSLANPLLNLVGVLAIARTMRQVAPDRPVAALAAAAFAAASAQVVVGGMTAFAMPGYFALNAVWLMLWTAPGAWPFAAALLGVVATGWHNPAMHPLFVAPFLLLPLRERRWGLLAWTATVYLVVGLLWLEVYFGYRDGAAVIAGVGASPLSLPDLRRLVSQAGYLTLLTTWQAPVVIGLAAVALKQWRSLPSVLRDAALSFAGIWLFFLFFTEPQGNGWGYRYVHGHLSVLCLLAGWGAASLPWTRGTARALVASCLLSVVLLLPVRGWQIHGYVAPFAATDRYLSEQPAGTALLIDPLDVWYGVDLARNPPDVPAPPRLNMRRTGPAEVQALIDSGTPVRRVSPDELTQFGLTRLRR